MDSPTLQMKVATGSLREDLSNEGGTPFSAPHHLFLDLRFLVIPCEAQIASAQVSEWRCGKVSARDSEANTLVVIPWPNPGVHPVEAVRLAREAAAEVRQSYQCLQRLAC